MEADAAIGPRIETERGGREDELPDEIAGGLRGLAVEGFGHWCVAEAAGEVAFVKGAHAQELLAEARFHRLGKHGPAILAALAVPNHDQVVAAIEILDPQTEHFEKPQAGTVLQESDESVDAIELGDDPLDFFGRKNHGKALRSIGANNAVDAVERALQDVFVQEEQSTEGLILRRSGDVAIDREIGEEFVDFGFGHVRWMAFVVE